MHFKYVASTQKHAVHKPYSVNSQYKYIVHGGSDGVLNLICYLRLTTLYCALLYYKDCVRN